MVTLFGDPVQVKKKFAQARQPTEHSREERIFPGRVNVDLLEHVPVFLLTQLSIVSKH
ncbi:hypothetical protein D3C83_234900 [compost metagenome]